LLVHVPLGPRPSLHLLRSRSPGVVRWLRRYYGGVRLLGFVHHRLRLLVFPMRTSGIPPLAKPEISRFPRKELPHMPGSSTTPGRAGACDNAPAHIAFRDFEHVGTQIDSSFRSSMAGLCAPLPTLRRHPHERRRTARGRCGSLLLHRGGLSPPTLCRF